MDFVRDFFITYFPLLIIAVGMFCVAMYDYKIRKRVCSYIIAIMGTALVLAIFLELEHYGCYLKNQVFTTIFAFLGYSIRPFVVFLFILLADGKVKKKRFWLFIPLFLNLLIYSFSLFIGTPLEKLVFYYALDPEQGILVHHRGNPIILCFSGHIVSAFLIAYLIVITLKKIRTRHSVDSFAILSCIFFVVVAVTVESLTNYSGLLNNAIGICCVFYYLFMFNEMNRRDVLTGLFDRKTYYLDQTRFGRDVTGVIHMDVNGLKALNDGQGHEEGDKAIVMVAKTIKDSINRDMYGYRLGGDEFVVLCVNSKEEDIINIMKVMRERLEQTPYSASFGHGMRKDKEQTVDEILKSAEIEMYNDKNLYYTSHHIDRRRR